VIGRQLFVFEPVFRSDRRIKVKNRQHPAFRRVMEQF
jgi:hypothetical protein